jgi:hypothetical protein
MQPFPMMPPPPQPKREVPSYLKLLLVLKALGCLFTVGLSFLMLTTLNRAAAHQHPTSEQQASMQLVAEITMIAAGMSLVELLGVVGTWSFKRWGVYVLAGFSMMNFVLRLRSGDQLGASMSLAMSVLVGVGIALRWKDFE